MESIQGWSIMHAWLTCLVVPVC
uniref:Uncharacterized protein n=1 Tax=Arundo donax TaxID=35708 RepID=A0A0A9HEX1_ARUDO